MFFVQKKAGFADTQVLECHGSIHWLQCQSPACNEKIWPADGFRPQIDASVGRLRNKPPICPMCGGVARPNILMFNDWHWVEELAIARKERLADWLSKVERLVTIELGAGNAIRTVRRFGGAMEGQLIRINPTDEEIGESQEGVAIRLGALDGLNGIAEALVERGFLSQENKPRTPLVSVETSQLSIEINQSVDAGSPIQLIAKHLRKAKRVLFITGAGISADSGLPTYRGVSGLYNDTGTEEGISIETALSAHVFATRPEITWKYLAQIEQTCRGAEPNAAHLAIAELEQHIPYVLTLTQNVDGLHRTAGSSDVIEIHGGLHSLFCTKCDFKESVVSLEGRALPPHCPKCGALVRPNVVLFDEALPLDAVERLHESTERGFDIVITIGTSGIFPYISRPVIQAEESGIFTVEINPIKTKLSKHVNVHLEMGAAQAMLAIMAEI